MSNPGDKTERIKLRAADREWNRLAFDHVDVPKVDTEGWEVEILSCLGERLKDVDYVLVEYHSEQDRRTIDTLLTSHTLFGSHAPQIGLGTMKYVRTALIDNVKICMEDVS